MLWLIERFGVKAITGKDVLSAGEIRGMIAAEAVYRAYQSKDGYRDQDGNANWAEWSRQHPDQDRLLNRALMEAQEMDDDGS